MVDAYAPCPCGSGKKFKWCCQPIAAAIDKVMQLDEEGQHEAAIKAMEALAVEHEGNPEVWGRYAQMLYANDKVEEAEKVLQKALEINPNYPYGYFLRAHFRLYEGEVPGALMLLRKAAELYDPQARDVLAQVYSEIFNCEMRLNHPVAARAALGQAYHLHPIDELRKGLDSVFGDENSNLPKSARQEYKLMPLPPGASAARQAQWKRALEGATTGKLADAVKAFEQLTSEDGNDPAAWYNLALAQAWSGNNLAALEALERYVALETDEARAAAAWTLAEVLKCGQGLEDHGDFVEHTVILQLRDPNVFLSGLERMAKEGVVGGLAVTEDRTTLTGVVVEPPPPALTEELAAKQSPKLGAFFICMGPIFRLWHPSKESLDKAVEHVRPHLGATSEPMTARGPAKFGDLFAETLIFTSKSLSADERLARFRESAEQFYEGPWIHRPLKALSQTPAIDAAGHPLLRKKLRGMIDFLQECASLGGYPYDFDRLRRKLGFLEGVAAAAGEKPTDIAVMGSAELAMLDRSSLPDDQLEIGFQTAMKLDAKELAGGFAKSLVERPSRSAQPDRFVWFNHLVTQTLQQGEGGEALDWINAGEKDDCEHNEGRRRNDYELRRAQVQAKTGAFGDAAATFERLLQRDPSQLKMYGAAAEALLSARQGPQALTFAEKGLAEARKQNNRDQEGYFLELTAAAKRQGN